jgi:Dyp-type peroxidase family
MSAAASPATPGTQHPDLDDIQGNLVGFNKDHQRLVFLGFPGAATGKAFLAAIAPRISSAREVKAFNALFKEIRGRAGEEGIVEATWVNIALTAAGLRLVGAPGVEAFPGDFLGGMAAQAQQLGDVEDSAPTTWVAPFNNPGAVHAMVIIGADSAEDRDSRYAHLQATCTQHAVVELGHQDGDVREGAGRGHEHFGFKDGISQPGIRGITRSSKTGQDTIATGEFLIGYPDEAGNISGQPPAGPAPQPGQPGYSPNPVPTPAAPLPDWGQNGSFLVYRRLRQDVGAFNEFVAQQAQQIGMDPEQLAAKLVGRWRSGAPMEHVPGLPHGVDAAAADPFPAHPEVLNDSKINDFDYEPNDIDGHAVPHAAHIRKVNPRSSNPNGGKADGNRHRILRRGAPYGPEFQPGESPYGGAPVGDDRDRGLLFLCYQSSIERGFAFIQQTWANARDFPQAGDGEDPIIAQAIAQREFNLPPRQAHLLMARWVFTTGGEYFFSPSISALTQLAA